MSHDPIEKHEPIPKGGLKLLALPFVGILIYFGSLHALTLLNAMNQLVMALSITLTLLAVLSYLFIISNSNPLKWFAEYWHRNIMGRKMVFWVDADKNNRIKKSFFNNKEIYDYQCSFLSITETSPVAVIIILGGWRRHPVKVIINKKDMRGWGKYWKFKKIRSWPGYIKVIDHLGSTIKLPAEYLVEMLLNAKHPQDFHPWDHQVYYKSKEFRQVSAELDETKLARIKATDVIMNVSTMIQDTSRFVHSKEGKKIRKYIEDQLIELLPINDSIRKKLLSRKAARERAA